MTKKLSGGITYQKLEGLADPMRKEVALRKESSSPVKKLVYLTGADSSSFVSETVSVHCGVFNENGGFSISDEDNNLRMCLWTFGGGDNLYQPIGLSKASTQKVCYVAFWDDVTLATKEAEGHKTGENSLWINS
ncbi:hypothetical protein Bca52824_039503 [Brassica carinata]|uniref:TOD1/MUCI70 glycosyltransferase-like domain-containing protein n=1 Tax=Brassica carinata TaxID=52824 RepID=A0A8X7RPI3_BRACI|nr:hypothetical protein Bca52824_039503 [Brassica carinata]